MVKKLTMVDARAKLTRLPETLRRRQGTIAVTRKGEPVLAIMPWALYEGIVEAQADPRLAASLARSLEQIERGEVVSSAHLRKQLGLA